jgi:FAD/FMN-containing dehydrogenase
MSMKGDAKALAFVEDAAVAPERLRDYIRELLELVAAHGTEAGVYAHASVGCLHVRPVVDLKTEAGVRTFESIALGVADLVLKHGGALSRTYDGLSAVRSRRACSAANLRGLSRNQADARSRRHL